MLKIAINNCLIWISQKPYKHVFPTNYTYYKVVNYFAKCQRKSNGNCRRNDGLV